MKMKVNESQLEDVIKSGEFELPAAQSVNVVDPSGQVGSIPSEQLKDALSQGYKIEKAFDGAVRKEVESRKGSTVEALKVFATQAADELALGIPEVIYDKTANPFDRAVREKLKEEYEAANIAGGVLGFGGSLFFGGPLFKGAAKAGTQAAKVVSNQLAKAGVKRGSESLAKDILARTAENATKLGVEGAAITAPRAITETALGDPNAAAESLMMGGGVGVALGVITGPTGALFSKLNKYVNKRYDEALAKGTPDDLRPSTTERAVPDPNTASDGSLLGDLEQQGANRTILEKARAGLGRQKDNASDIQKAAASLDVPVLDEMLAAEKVVQDMGSALAQSPTMTGYQRATKYQKIFDGIDNTIKSVFNIRSLDDASAFEVGEKVKTDILTTAKSSINSLGELFNAARLEYAQIPTDTGVMRQVSRNIKALSRQQLDPTAEQVLKRVSRQIDEGRISDLNQLFELRSQLYDLYGANRSVNKAVGDIVKKLNLQEETTIDRAIKRRIEQAKSQPGGQTLIDAVEIQAKYDEVQGLKKKWAELAESLEEGTDALSLGNFKNPRDFVSRVEGLSAEQVVKRMFPKGDIARLRSVSQKYPEQFRMVADLYKAQLLDGSVRDGRVQMGFFNKWKNLPKEVQDVLVGPDGVQTIRNARTVYEAIPANINPSGTAKTLSIMSAMGQSPLGFIMSSGSDFIKGQAIKKLMSVEGVLGAESSINRTRSVFDKIPEYLKAFEKGEVPLRSGKPASAINRLIGDDGGADEEALQKLEKKLGDTVANPVRAIDEVSKITTGLSETGAPMIAQAFSTKLVQSAQYLYNAMPKARFANQFSKVKVLPSASDVRAFERKLEVVQDPFRVFEFLADGSLTKDHVEALAINYPLVYQTMKTRIFDEIAKNPSALSYQKRLKLSLLLGTNLDPSLDGQTIANLQSGGAMQEQIAAEEESPGLRQSGLNKMKSDKGFMTESQRLLSKT